MERTTSKTFQPSSSTEEISQHRRNLPAHSSSKQPMMERKKKYPKDVLSAMSFDKHTLHVHRRNPKVPAAVPVTVVPVTVSQDSAVSVTVPVTAVPVKVPVKVPQNVPQGVPVTVPQDRAAPVTDVSSSSPRKRPSEAVYPQCLIKTKPAKRISLGNRTFASIRTYRKDPRVNIRDYASDDHGDHHALKRGILLTTEQWEVLKQNMEAIDEGLKRRKSDIYAKL